MVLDEKCARVAERLSLNIAFDKFPEARATIVIRAAPLGLGTAEKSKPHSLLLFLNIGATQTMDNSMICDKWSTVCSAAAPSSRRVLLDLLPKLVVWTTTGFLPLPPS